MYKVCQLLTYNLLFNFCQVAETHKNYNFIIGKGKKSLVVMIFHTSLCSQMIVYYFLWLGSTHVIIPNDFLGDVRKLPAFIRV